MKLAMLFTFGTSLETWYNQGILDREKLIYEEFIRQGKFEKIYWFTYGVNDKKFAYLIDDRIEIIPLHKSFKIKPAMIIYSFLMPFLHAKYFKEVSVIKTNQMKGGWTAWIASVFYKKRFVFRGGYIWSIFAIKKYGGVYSLIVDLVEGLLCKLAHAVIVTSKFQKDYIVNKYRLRKNKVFLITNYVDTGKFKPLNNSLRVRDRLVFVGRIHRDKNLKNLLSAMQGLPLGLDIYGDGPLRREIQKLAEQKDMDVKFMGVAPNTQLPEVFKNYVYFILPSAYEGMPKALLEAMACGLVVVGTNVEGIKEVIKDGYNGLLIEDASVGKIRQALQDLSRKKEAEEAISVNARKYIEDNFSLAKIAQKEFEVLQ